jgi:prepilin-type N-terminal cleavage/methylation domain-containing protein
MQRPATRAKKRRGFTLVELAGVIVIVGVLAAFGVPRFLKSVEKSKASEAFGYLSAVRSAQERYQSQQGCYAGRVADLDIQYATPKYFRVGAIGAGSTSSLESSWKLTLTRAGAPARYSSYTVVFTDQGYDPSSTIDSAISPARQ